MKTADEKKWQRGSEAHNRTEENTQAKSKRGERGKKQEQTEKSTAEQDRA